MEKYAYKIPHKTNIAKGILGWAKKEKFWSGAGELKNRVIAGDDGDGFLTPSMSRTVPSELYKDCPAIKILAECGDILPGQIQVFKTAPFEMYKFHNDGTGYKETLIPKAASVNLLLQETRANFLFYDNEHVDKERVTFYEHQYDRDYLYLLNVQQQHGWFNYEGDRYILIIRIGSPDYTEIVSRLKKKFS
jgi:hypothetical protein